MLRVHITMTILFIYNWVYILKLSNKNYGMHDDAISCAISFLLNESSDRH